MSDRFSRSFSFFLVGILSFFQILTAQVVGPPKPTAAQPKTTSTLPKVKPPTASEATPPASAFNSPSLPPASALPMMDADGVTPLYDLERCINLALQNNFKIKAAQANIEGKLGGVIVARATLYPTVDLSARLSGSNQDPFHATKSSEDSRYIGDWGTRIRVTQNIFSGFANRNRIAAAKLEHEAEYFQYQAVVNQTIFDLKSEFYTILLRQTQIVTTQETIKLLQSEFDRQKNLFEAGRSTKFSILRVQVNLANEKSNLTSLEQSIVISQAKLSDLMGVSWGGGRSLESSFKITGDLSNPPFSLDLPTTLQLAKTRRPELQYFTKRAEAAGLKAKAERSSNIPRINLYGQVDERNNQAKPAFFDQAAEFSTGVEGIWNVFDGFYGKGRAMQQEAIKETNLAQKMDTLGTVETEVRTAFAHLTESRRVIETQKENIERAEESVKLSQLNVETGYGTVLDVLQATIDLSRARNLETEARYDYLIAIANLEKSISVRFNNNLNSDEKKP